MKEPSFISVSITILFLILLSGCSSTDDEILNDEVIEDLLINDTIHEDIEDLISETEDVPTEQV
ncbi:hypothetical protein J4476_03920, partial [Candidatus Woesearchaeota archaeon]|nr:hypothetical protein [Candidatus Woesearchaeota archaeon]